MIPPLCEACGRRPAVYKRRASGEVLCLKCLERALIKALRRGLATLASPDYGSTLAFIPLRSSPIASSGTAHLFGVLAKRYSNSVLVVGHPDAADLAAGLIEEATNERPEVLHVDVFPLDPVPGPVSEARSVAEALREEGAIVAVTPITATDILLDSLVRLMIYGLRPCECALPRYLVGDAVIVSPLSRVLLTDINAFVALRGFPTVRSADSFAGVRGADWVKKLVAELERRNPETIYRFVKFLQAVLLSGRVMPQNGGFIPSLW